MDGCYGIIREPCAPMLSCRVQEPLVGLWASDVGRGEAGEVGVGGRGKGKMEGSLRWREGGVERRE